MRITVEKLEEKILKFLREGYISPGGTHNIFHISPDQREGIRYLAEYILEDKESPKKKLEG